MQPVSDIYFIYCNTFPSLPISEEMLINKLDLGKESQIKRVEYVEDKPVAACVYNECGISFLAVLPERQRRGIGGRLLGEAEDYVKSKGGTRVTLGDAGSYLWPGVPEREKGAVCFFQKHGYTSDWTSMDLVLDLREYKNPIIPPCDNKVHFELCGLGEKDKLMECVENVEKDWVIYFKETSHDRILLAKHQNEIIAFAILMDSGITISGCFPGRMGGIGCVGVREAYRKRGVGLQLVKEGTERIKEEGFDYSYIGYTWLEEWYGRLGYNRYLSYWMGYKKIAATNVTFK